jgi:hypothetical protein
MRLMGVALIPLPDRQAAPQDNFLSLSGIGMNSFASLDEAEWALSTKQRTKESTVWLP